MTYLGTGNQTWALVVPRLACRDPVATKQTAASTEGEAEKARVHVEQNVWRGDVSGAGGVDYVGERFALILVILALTYHLRVYCCSSCDNFYAPPLSGWSPSPLRPGLENVRRVGCTWRVLLILQEAAAASGHWHLVHISSSQMKWRGPPTFAPS